MVSETNTNTDTDPVENGDEGATENVEADAQTQQEEPKIPETIEFRHKFFTVVEGTYFRAGEREGECFMVTPLAEATVELTLNGIKRELKLKDNSHDGFMLGLVAKSLKYVQRIAVGDKVPSEILSGNASWEVTEEHRIVAQKRLTMQLITWLTGEEEVFTDLEQLEMVADDPTNKAKINDAFEKAAKELGIPVEEKEKVIDLVNDFAEELAYIEALRGQFIRLLLIEKRVEELNPIYINDNRVFEILSRVSSLSKNAFDSFRSDFKAIDLSTKHIIDVLKYIPEKTKTVRKFRDDLHSRFFAWRDLIEEWELTPAQRSVGMEELLQETYQFLAQRFMPQDEWELFTKALENTLKMGNEQIW